MERKAIKFLKIPRYNGPGIYAIVNWEDFSCYVGSSKNIKNRIQAHKTALKNGKHPNKHIQDAADNNKILRAIIIKKVPEDIDSDFMLTLEYIAMYEMLLKSFNLYNLVPSEKNNGVTIKSLQDQICFLLSFQHRMSDGIEKGLEDVYYSTSGRMKNTRYREILDTIKD